MGRQMWRSMWSHTVTGVIVSIESIANETRAEVGPYGVVANLTTLVCAFNTFIDIYAKKRITIGCYFMRQDLPSHVKPSGFSLYPVLQLQV